MEDDIPVAGNEGVEATDVAGVSGALSFPVIDAENRIESSFGNSLMADSASLVVLSRRNSAGLLLPRTLVARPSLTLLGVLACLRERVAILMDMLVFLPTADASNTPFLDSLGGVIR